MPPVPKVRNAFPALAEARATTAGTMKSPPPSSVMMAIRIPTQDRMPVAPHVLPPTAATAFAIVAKAVIPASMSDVPVIAASSLPPQVHLPPIPPLVAMRT